jgi:hypothetical protein
MFQALRKHLTPSTLIAFMALVFAVTGGAFAASSRGGGSGVKATTVAPAAAAKAKPKAKPGPRGPAGPKGATGATGATGPGGPAGPVGLAGAAGGKGETGVAGSNGTSGTNGESVTNTPLAAGKGGCKEGGSEFKVGSGAATKACNGTTGFTEKLPSGKTETGSWAARPVEGEEAFIPVSFNIPLSAPLGQTATHFLRPPVTTSCENLTGTELKACEEKKEKEETQALKEFAEFCPGSAEEPKADPGSFCVYTGFLFHAKVQAIFQASGVLSLGIGRSGGSIVVDATGKPAIAYGSWAVTAE